MNFSVLVRQSHRWLSIAFTVAVIANFAVRALGEPPAWVTYSPLAPLFLLLFTGLYMLVLPHMGRSPPQRRNEAAAMTADGGTFPQGPCGT